MSVSVCLSVREDISGTTRAIFTNFSVHVAYGRGSVLLRQDDEIPRGRGNFGGCPAHSKTLTIFAAAVAAAFPAKGIITVMSASVCLCVCVSACLCVCLFVCSSVCSTGYLGTTREIFTIFCACFLCPWFGPSPACLRQAASPIAGKGFSSPLTIHYNTLAAKGIIRSPIT